MPCKRVGFFFELSEDEQRNELTRLRRWSGAPDESKIIEYLLSGVDAGVAMVIEHDVLCDPPKPLGEAVIKSDGEWAWPASLAYYVGKYHIALPTEFVAKMARHGWRVPANAKCVSETPEGHVEM